MHKILILVGLIVLLSACTVYINGVQYDISLTTPATPTQEYATSVFTPVPTTTATPLPTVTPIACRVTANDNINMRRLPGGTYIYTILAGDTLTPDAYTMYNNLKYYRFLLPDQTLAWAADFFTEVGNCGGLPLVNPFLQ